MIKYRIRKIKVFNKLKKRDWGECKLNNWLYEVFKSSANYIISFYFGI